MAGPQTDPTAIVDPDEQRIATLNLLIDEQREIAKHWDRKRERADALAAAQITAATALSAILVTAAKSLPTEVPEVAAWGVLIALALTIISAVIARATFVSMWLQPEARKVRDDHDEAKAALADLQDDDDAAGTGIVPVQNAIREVWATRAAVDENAVDWKRDVSTLSGCFLLVAVGMLGWLAASVLWDLW